MTKQEKPKVGESVVIWFYGKLRTGKVTKVWDIVPENIFGNLTFGFSVSTKLEKQPGEYKTCELRGNSFSWYPCVDANIRWPKVQGLGDAAWFFRHKEDYINWLKNEYKYQLAVAELSLKGAKENYEREIDVELIDVGDDI